MADLEKIEAAAKAVQAGEVVVIPTDTVYGLGCDPRNDAAIDRIYEIKQRPGDLELNLLGASLEQLEPYVKLTRKAQALAELFWPGGVALVCDLGAERLKIPRHTKTLMIRVPDHTVLRRLLARTGPLASTSANLHSQPPATTAAEAEDALKQWGMIVIDGGTAGGVPSSIVDVTQETPRILRQGAVKAETLQPYL